MHTSSRLISENFGYFRGAENSRTQVQFGHFCPDYHELDRVGVVSPCLEDGVVGTSHALLALTTAFYDELRRGGEDFFDYPQHFAFVGAAASGAGAGDIARDGASMEWGVQSRGGILSRNTPNLWGGWSWLDVWPEAKWVTARPTALGMLQRIFDFQINRLFWPVDWRQSLAPVPNESSLPGYVWKMLQRSLKSIHLYAPDPALMAVNGVGETAGLSNVDDACWLEIAIAPPIAEVVVESLERLPGAADRVADRGANSQRFVAVPVGDFLAQLQALSPEQAGI